MRLSFVLITVLLLSACTSTFSTLQTGVPRFVGKDITYAIKYLGYPDDEVTVAGKKVYVWRDSFTSTGTVTSYRPQYITTYAPNGRVASNSTTIRENTPVTFSGDCKIRLVTSKEKVVDANFEGSGFGCDKYVDRVRKLIDDTEPEANQSKEPRK